MAMEVVTGTVMKTAKVTAGGGGGGNDGDGKGDGDDDHNNQTTIK